LTKHQKAKTQVQIYCREIAISLLSNSKFN